MLLDCLIIFSFPGRRTAAARSSSSLDKLVIRSQSIHLTVTYTYKMRLVLFRTRGAPSTAPLRVGALHPDGQHVADISSAYADAGVPALSSMRTFLELGAPAREVANRALSSSAYWRALEHVDLRAPIYDPCVVPRVWTHALHAGALRAHSHNPSPCLQREGALRRHELRGPLLRAEPAAPRRACDL